MYEHIVIETICRYYCYYAISTAGSRCLAFTTPLAASSSYIALLSSSRIRTFGEQHDTRPYTRGTRRAGGQAPGRQGTKKRCKPAARGQRREVCIAYHTWRIGVLVLGSQSIKYSPVNKYACLRATLPACQCLCHLARLGTL